MLMGLLDRRPPEERTQEETFRAALGDLQKGERIGVLRAELYSLSRDHAHYSQGEIVIYRSERTFWGRESGRFTIRRPLSSNRMRGISPSIIEQIDQDTYNPRS